MCADGACVSIYLPETDEVLSAAATGMLAEVPRPQRPADESLWGGVIRRSRSIVDNDLTRPNATPRTPDLPASVARVVAVPLVSKGEALGALSLVRAKERPGFSTTDVRRLVEYAVSAGLAIEGAGLLEEAWESAEAEARLRRDAETFVSDLFRLHTAEVSIASDTDLDEVLDQVVTAAAELTGARRAALGLIHPTKRGFDRFVYSADDRTRSSRPGGTGHDDPIDKIIADDRPICALCSPECFCEGEIERAPASTRGYLIGMPVTLRGDVLGILYLCDKPARAMFTEWDEAIVRLLAGQAAVMIDKARVLAERLAAIRELETQTAVRSRLSAYVNHDIRNALHGVALWAERLADGARADDASRVGEFAARIEQGTTHALRLVRDVLDLTALEEGRLQTWARHVALGQLLGSAVAAVTPQAEAADMRIVVDCESDVDLWADPDRVRQILTNLLHNAVKFSPDGSIVRVVARSRALGPDGAPAPWVSIDVQDEGPGIAEERVAQIFGAYERGMAGRRDAGLGLGLTISRFLAEHMGGHLFVRTSPGKGSTFTLWLPREGDIGMGPAETSVPDESIG